MEEGKGGGSNEMYNQSEKIWHRSYYDVYHNFQSSPLLYIHDDMYVFYVFTFNGSYVDLFLGCQITLHYPSSHLGWPILFLNMVCKLKKWWHGPLGVIL